MYFLDTNALLNIPLNEFDFGEKFYISSESLKEIEDIKTSFKKDMEIKAKSREVIRFLDQNEDKYIVNITKHSHYNILDKFKLPTTADNLIIAGAYEISQIIKLKFISFDLACRNIGKNIFGLDVYKFEDKENNLYTGYKEIKMSDDELAEFYSNTSYNGYDILTNEYIIVKNSNDEVIDKLRWDGKCFNQIKYRTIGNDFSGKIKPRNIQQELASDLLQDESIEIKLITGKFGVGKDYLMVGNALHFVKNKRYEKILWVRNNIDVKNTKELGALPGNKNEKLMPWAAPLADQTGGPFGLEMWLNTGEIELEHLGHIRGRDIKNTIIMCSEAENMTKEHIQLLIGRVGEGSTLWLNGDLKQIDNKVFEDNNGIEILIDRLKGNRHFGFVKLQKTERSEVADLADLLD